MHHTTTLETTRLQLRKPTKSDIPYFRDLWKNEVVRQFLGGIVQDNLIDEKIASLQDHWNKNGFGQWAVYIKNGNQAIGLCGLHCSADGVELSYMLFPEWWGKGIANESASASLDYGFKYLSIEKIIAITQKANTKSLSLLENIGMRKTNSFSRYNAEQYLYELTKSEFIQASLSTEN